MRGTKEGRREKGREAKAKVLHGKIKVSILVWGGGGGDGGLFPIFAIS